VWLGHRSVPTHQQGEQLAVVWKEPITNLQIEADARDRTLVHAEQGRKLYRITFGLGAIVIQVFGHDFPTFVEVEIPEERFVEGIWPVTGTFTWPLIRSTDAIGGVEGLHRAFGGSVPVPPKISSGS
jgi:hypothetical protein